MFAKRHIVAAQKVNGWRSRRHQPIPVQTIIRAPMASLSAGSRLGPYEIVGAIGAGGMGQVYRARDTRLDRDVAVKVLPEGFALDPDRRARFEREAKAVAALTHPNIVSLFDVGTQTPDAGAAVQFVVMELLDGETLRDRLKTTSTIPIRKAVEIAIQIARGLSGAHDKQLVHRDLKPENVFLTRDGHVKILDFGIAKAFLRDGSDDGATATAGTDPGSVIGTAGYMAPEQVRGQVVDARTDLFALGAVLYEMVSGKRAFAGETAAETMTAILREDPPDVLSTRTDAPPALDRIIRHCLEKNPSERFQTARDVAFALEALSGSGTAQAAAATLTSPVPVSTRGRLRFVWPGIAVLALVAAGALGAKLLMASNAPADWSGVALGGPAFASTPKLSPDGRTLAFIAMVGRNSQVAVMTPDSGDWAIRTPARTSPGYVTDIDWSPGGDLIYYGLNADVPRGIFSVPSVGGDEKLVLADLCAGGAGGWNDGGHPFRRHESATAIPVLAPDGSAERTANHRSAVCPVDSCLPGRQVAGRVRTTDD